jgi:hypothetical protein
MKSGTVESEEIFHRFNLGPDQWNKFKTTIRSALEAPDRTSMIVEVTLKLGYLDSLSAYQKTLIELILEKRDRQWTFDQIGRYLTEKGYKTARGNPMDGRHVFSILKKHRKKLESESYFDLEVI